MSTAKGLCLSTGARLVAVPTLQALAAASGASGLVIPVLPSRRGEVYAAAFREGEAIRDPAALALADLSGWLPEADSLTVTGPAAEQVCDAVTRPLAHAPSRPSGLEVARLGRSLAEAGHVEDVAAFEPAYLKPFVSGGA